MLIGNVGIGLFVLIIVWIVALIVFVFGIKYQNNVAWISLSVAATLTIILVIIPIDKVNQAVEEPIDNLDKDNTFIYQVILLSFLVLSALLGLVFFFILHCIEPIRPKPIKLF